MESSGEKISEQNTSDNNVIQHISQDVSKQSAPQEDRATFSAQNAQHNGRGSLNNRQNKNRPSQSRQPVGRGSDSLEGLLSNLGSGLYGRLGNLDTEDLLLLAVVYLMYRSSGDKQLLIMLAALLFA